MTNSKIVLTSAAVGVLWPLFVGVFASLGWIWQPIAPPGDQATFLQSVATRLGDDGPPNAAVTLVHEGEVGQPLFIYRDRPIGEDTLFQVMSISKWVTAWTVLTLVESETLELNAPIRRYLASWQLPESEYDVDGITVRRLLSHTAGLNSGDFDGFHPDQAMQPLVEYMSKPADGGAHGNVRLDQFEPGTSWRYSNNAYALLQHIVEQVTGESFEALAMRNVLLPLGMTNSTFDSGIASSRDLTMFYNSNGTESIHRRYGAVAPSSLYASSSDLAKFLLAHTRGNEGELPGRGVLSPDMVLAMQQDQTNGAGPWGLGVQIHSYRNGYTIGHNGVHFSDPAISTEVRLNPQTANGIVVLVSGRRLLAAELAMEWDYWETDRMPFLLILIKGWLVAVLGWLTLSALSIWILRRRQGFKR